MSMSSRRLDISSLLCDAEPFPPYPNPTYTPCPPPTLLVNQEFVIVPEPVILAPHLRRSPTHTEVASTSSASSSVSQPSARQTIPPPPAQSHTRSYQPRSSDTPRTSSSSSSLSLLLNPLPTTIESPRSAVCDSACPSERLSLSVLSLPGPSSPPSSRSEHSPTRPRPNHSPEEGSTEEVASHHGRSRGLDVLVYAAAYHEGRARKALPSYASLASSVDDEQRALSRKRTSRSESESDDELYTVAPFDEKRYKSIDDLPKKRRRVFVPYQP